MKHFARLAALYFVASILLKGAGFVLSLWLARSLPVREFGQWGWLYAFQTGLATLGIVGIVEAVISLWGPRGAASERRDLLASAISVFHVVVAVAMVGAVALVYIVADSQLGGFWVVAGTLSSGVFLAHAQLQAQVMRLDEKHFASLCFSFLVPALGLLCSAVAVLATGTVESFYVASALGLFAATLACRFAGIGHYGSGASHRERRQILARIPPYIVVALLGWLSGYGNNLVVGHLFASEDIARFTFAMSIGAVLQLVASALNQVWGPRFYRITHTSSFEEVERNNRRFFSLQSLAMGVVGALVLALLPHLLTLLGGNLSFYASMGWELYFVVIAYICLSPWWHCHNYFLAYDKGMDIRNIVLATSAVGLAAWVLLMFLLGELGIYVGFFVQMLIRSLGIAYSARKYWPVSLTWPSVAVGALISFGGLLLSGHSFI